MEALAEYLARRFGSLAEREVFEGLFSRLALAWQEGHTQIEDKELVRLSYPLMCSHEEALQGKRAFLVRDEREGGASLSLFRFWQMEWLLARCLEERLQGGLELVGDFEIADLNEAQVLAVRRALGSLLALIDGGPGTGKTRTLAQLIKVLLAENAGLRIALTAPTGKAAKRMEESFRATWQGEWPKAMEEAKTLHRLLGLSGKKRSHYHQGNPLPYDVLVLDEASMLSLELASVLFQALAPKTRVVLLGDAHQLSAVEAGAVFQDLCAHPRLVGNRVTLTESYRFSKDSGVGALARAVLEGGDKEQLREVIAQFTELSLSSLSEEAYQEMAKGYALYWQALRDGAENVELLALFNRYRILTPMHQGAFGTVAINRQMEFLHRSALGLSQARFFHGLPLMVLQNDYQNGLFNGDIGLCLEEQGRFLFYLGEDYPLLPLERIAPDLLMPAYALSVHKSQGSEFESVAIVVDKNVSERLLSRELLYTAITRAKREVLLFGALEDMAAMAEVRLQRETGLARFL